MNTDNLNKNSTVGKLNIYENYEYSFQIKKIIAL